MQNKSIKTHASAFGAVLLAVVFAMSLGATSAHAYYNSIGEAEAYNTYYHSPAVYSNGFYYTNTPPYSNPVVYSQPVYQQPIVVQQPVVYQQPVVIQQQPVVVQQPVVYQQPVTYVQPTPVVTYPLSNNNPGLQVGCYADPTTAYVEQPVTWSVEVTGGAGPYSYQWTGSNGLVGSSQTIVKYYGTSGIKSALVTVSSADGRSVTMACSNTITVHAVSTYHAPAPVHAQVAVAQAPAPVASQLQAGVFSLANLSWSWVAILVIIILFATVMYLMFNRPKI